MDIRRRLWIYIALLLLALGLMYWLNRSGQTSQAEPKRSLLPRDYPEVRAEGTLRVLAPYYLSRLDKSHKDNLQRLISKLSKRSGLEVQVLLEDNTQQALQLLTAGEVDLVLHAIERTVQLDSTALLWLQEDVAEPIYLVQRPDSLGQIARQLDLENSVIVLPRGSSLSLFVRHLADDLGFELTFEEDSLYNTEQLIMKVQSGTIDYTLCSGEERTRYKDFFPNLNFSVPISHNLRRGWITRRSAPMLADSLRHWLY